MQKIVNYLAFVPIALMVLFCAMLVCWVIDCNIVQKVLSSGTFEKTIFDKKHWERINIYSVNLCLQCNELSENNMDGFCLLKTDLYKTNDIFEAFKIKSKNVAQKDIAYLYKNPYNKKYIIRKDLIKNNNVFWIIGNCKYKTRSGEILNCPIITIQ
ncbi:hypothetical protein [uncultured Methanobrevibacter sp.]|uniref:hypothetical protein n=1 Tax=uncultured Methanobrevibacter sp. TaxID=253161 RepID=UPI0025E17D66|nr:hypothetical protein [uncultured Methanobrevibacter sp.]